jgi:hypothetical protein
MIPAAKSVSVTPGDKKITKLRHTLKLRDQCCRPRRSPELSSFENFKKQRFSITSAKRKDLNKYSLIDTFSFKKNDSLQIRGKRIVAKYISAIGGKDLISKIMDRTIFLTGLVNNLHVDMTIYQKIPNKYYQKVVLGAVEQKVIFDGEKGIMITGNDTQKIRGADLEKLKYEATMELMLYLNAYNVKAEYAGVEKVKEHNAYKVILLFPEGMQWTEYYDADSYFKVKEIKPVMSPGRGVVSQVSYFYDYNEVEGVKYPFKITQELGASQFEFSVDSIKINTGLIDRNFEIN